MSIETFPDTLTAKEAAQQLGVTRGLIELWAKGGCPFLDGAKLTRFANPHSRKGVRYDAAQVASIQAARSAVSKAKAGDYLTFEEARKRYKISQGCLYTWHDKGCCFLNGAKLDGHQEMRPVARRNGLREIWVYNREQLERIAELRDRERSGIFEDEQGAWLSARAAHQIYAIWDASLGDWQTAPCSFLGRTVTHKPMRRLLQSGRYQTRIVYLERDLEAIAAAQRAPITPATYEDAEGTWLFAVEVAQRTGWPQDGLWYYRKKEWPCLSSGRLRAKPVSAENHPCPNVSLETCWVYHSEDVETLAAFLRGERQSHQAETPSTKSARKRGPGRPFGSVDPEVQERNARMIEAWDSGDYAGPAELGKAFGVDRSLARKILLAAHRCGEKNSPSR